MIYGVYVYGKDKIPIKRNRTKSKNTDSENDSSEI